MDTDAHGLLLENEMRQIIGVRDGSAERSRTRAVGTDVPPPYENALVVEFGLRGIAYEQQARFNVVYKRAKVGEYIPDLIVFDRVVAV